MFEASGGRAAEEIVMTRDADITILRKRGMLATVRRVVAHSVGGAEVETAPLRGFTAHEPRKK